MKKILKITTSIAMLGMIFISSGCACTASKKKIEQDANSVKSVELFGLDNESSDYTITYTGTTTKDDDTSLEVTYVIKRDRDTDKFEIEVKTDTSTSKTQIYKENNRVYTVNIDDNGNKGTPTVSQYISIYDELKENYVYMLIKELYNSYKAAPYNAFLDEGDKTQIPSILASVAQLETKAKKKLFKNVYIYHLEYRVSVMEFYTVDITTTKGKMTSVKIDSDKNTSNEGHIDTVYNFTVNYDDVSLN